MLSRVDIIDAGFYFAVTDRCANNVLSAARVRYSLPTANLTAMVATLLCNGHFHVDEVALYAEVKMAWLHIASSLAALRLVSES